MKAMKIEVGDRFEDNGAVYTEVRINKSQACCVKETKNGLTYILECADGNDVYSWIGGADYPLRTLTDEERAEVISYIRKGNKS